MNKFFAIVMGLFAFACGGVPDADEEDLFPVEVTHVYNADGTEEITTRRLPFEYGQLQQALTVAPPDRYGERSDISGTSNDNRCPSGGFTSGTSFCFVPGQRHINWDLTQLFGNANGIDAIAGIRTRDYLLMGFGVHGQEAGTTGFTHEKENPNRSIDGTMIWNGCSAAEGFAYACTQYQANTSVTLAGGQRIRFTHGPYEIRFTQALANDIAGMNASQKAFELQNIMQHEMGHTENNGHVPSGESDVDIMNFINGKTNTQVKHLSSAQKSRMTAWFGTWPRP